MSSRPELRIDWATHEAAAHACTRWHYSRRMPVFGTVKVGVWEAGRFVGVVIFSRGATPEIGSPYGLPQTEICELTRVALRDHVTPVSRIIAIALKFLRKNSPGLRMVVSFADAAHGHHGGIYQASGWIYVGASETHAYRVHGVAEHPKTLHSRYGTGGQSIPWLRKNVDPKAERIIAGIKYRYLMPLDEGMRAQVAPLSKPYPKRQKQAMAGHHLAQRPCSADPDAPPSDQLHARPEAEAHTPEADRGQSRPPAAADGRAKACARAPRRACAPNARGPRGVGPRRQQPVPAGASYHD